MLHYPAILVHCLLQRQHDVEQTMHAHSPTDDKPLLHQRGPRSHHTQFPIHHCSTLQLFLIMSFDDELNSARQQVSQFLQMQCNHFVSKHHGNLWQTPYSVYIWWVYTLYLACSRPLQHPLSGYSSAALQFHGEDKSASSFPLLSSLPRPARFAHCLHRI